MEIRALSRVRVSGKRFSPGDLITGVDEAMAVRLLTLQVAEPFFSVQPVTEEVQPEELMNPEEVLSEDPPDRVQLEEEYRALGGLPREDWPLEKLLTKLEERRKV